MAETGDGIVHVDYASVQRAVEEMGIQTGAIKSALADLETELAPLVHSWEGADSTEYGKKQKLWDQAAAKMGEILGSHGNLLSDIHDGYRTSENKLAQQWADVSIGR